MRRLPARLVLGLAVVIAAVPPARAVHDQDITDDEAACQVGTAFAVWKAVYARAKCLVACHKAARGGGGDIADCTAPFGGETFGCITAAEAKGEAGEKKKCAKDCPECFSGGDCHTDAAVRIARVSQQVDNVAVDVYCDDSGSPDGVNAREGRCQDITAKYLTKYAYARLKCLAKCRKSEHAGKVPLGNCGPVDPLDPKTAECVAGARGRTVANIDKQCEASIAPSADEPECGPYPTSVATDWIAMVDVAIEAEEPTLTCGSPAAAFIE